MVAAFANEKRRGALLMSMSSHIYLSHSVTDILVRLCTMPKVPIEMVDEYHDLRVNILQQVVNDLETDNKLVAG
jgi:hypothetical protein